MKVVKIKYNGFVMVYNPIQCKYVDFRPVDVYHMKEVYALQSRLTELHPSCTLEVVHGKHLTKEHLRFLRCK